MNDSDLAELIEKDKGKQPSTALIRKLCSMLLVKNRVYKRIQIINIIHDYIKQELPNLNIKKDALEERTRKICEKQKEFFERDTQTDAQGYYRYIGPSIEENTHLLTVPSESHAQQDLSLSPNFHSAEKKSMDMNDFNLAELIERDKGKQPNTALIRKLCSMLLVKNQVYKRIEIINIIHDYIKQELPDINIKKDALEERTRKICEKQKKFFERDIRTDAQGYYRYIGPSTEKNTHQSQQEVENIEENMHQSQREVENIAESMPQSQQEVENIEENTHQSQREVENIAESMPQSQQEVENIEENTHQSQQEVENIEENTHQAQQEVENIAENTHQSQQEVENIEENTHQSQQEVENIEENTHQSQQEVENIAENTHQSQREVENIEENTHQSQQEVENIEENTHQSQREVENIAENTHQSQQEVENIEENTHQSQQEVENIAENTHQSQQEVENIAENTPQSQREAENDAISDDLETEQTYGNGQCTVYLWSLPMYQGNPNSEGYYPIKIGKTSRGSTEKFRDFESNLPESPVILIEFRCLDDAEVSRLENFFHWTFITWKINNAPGQEWFLTSPEKLVLAYKMFYLKTDSPNS